LLFRLSGVFLLRLAVRVFLVLVFQEPPRTTRFPRLPKRPPASASGHSWTIVREKIVAPNRSFCKRVVSACWA
jgi:hypothetical protein